MTSATQHALVVGATGLVGQALVKQLLLSDTYSRVTTFSRSPLPDAMFNLSERQLDAPSTQSKLNAQQVDFTNINQWQHKLQGDTLFCCLGTTIKQAGSKAVMRQVDYEYPTSIAQAARINGVKNLVFVSSMNANATARSFYLSLKGQTEQSLAALQFEKTLFVRPSVLTGERKQFRFAEHLGAVILNTLQKIPLFKKYQPINAESVAASMIQLIGAQHDTIHIAENIELHNI